MTRRIVSFPYSRPDHELVEAGEWVDQEDNPAFPGGMIRGWDPSYLISARRTLVADFEGIREQCSLGENARLRVIATWRSPGTSLRPREVGNTECLEISVSDPPQQVTISIQIEGAQLAGEVIISTSIVLGDAGEGAGVTAPYIPGSILWHDEIRVFIEGKAARFPVEMARFPPDSLHAAWYLDVSSDLEQPFLGGARLYLNSDHPAVISALESSADNEAAGMFFSAMMFDVGRQLISAGLNDDEFVENCSSDRRDPPYDRESTGRAIWGLLRIFAGVENASELKRRMDISPSEYERAVQHCLRIFGGGGE